jgi:small subunit ribosomal protein S17
MADEPDNETPESTETPEASAPDTAAAPEAEAPTPETADEPAAEPAEEPVEEPAEATASEASATTEAAAPAEPVEQLSSKERRRKARSTHSGVPAPARSPEDRHAERLTERRAKAVSRRARRLQERAKRAAKRQSSTATPVQELAPVHAAVEGKRTVRQGIVVSDRADKTITVRIDFARRHRRYEKIVRSSSTLHAHDESNDAHEGDTVRVIESRPLSKNKRWALVDVVERAR